MSSAGRLGPSGAGELPPPRNGLARAALATGVVALLGSWVPLYGAVFGLLGVVAIVLGARAVGRASRLEATDKASGGWALGLGIGAFVVALVVNAVLVGAYLLFGECSQLPDPAAQAQCTQDRLDRLGLG